MSNAEFHRIDRKTWPREPYFTYYYDRLKCRYNVTAQLDIMPLLECKRRRGWKFFPLMLYVVMTAVNNQPEFRMGFDQDGQLGYWSEVVPCYTIFHGDTKTFSDIWSDYDRDVFTFYQTVCADMKQYQDVHEVKAKPHQPDNFCPVSALPWLHFTSFGQDSYGSQSPLFPLIKVGKYEWDRGRVQIPVAVSVNHAAADGYHTCTLFRNMQEIIETLGVQPL